MKLNLDFQIKDHLDRLIVSDPAGKVPFTGRDAVVQALLADTQNNGATKAARYALFKRVAAGESDFPVEDISAIKQAVLDGLPTIVAGRVIDQIEGETVPVVKAPRSK